MVKEELIIYDGEKYKLYFVNYDKNKLENWIYKIIDKHKKVIEFDKDNKEEVLKNKYDNGKIQGLELTDKGYVITTGEVYEYPEFIRNFYIREQRKFGRINMDLENFSIIIDKLVNYDSKNDFISTRLANKYISDYFSLCSIKLESDNIICINDQDKELAKNNNINIKKLVKSGIKINL